MNGKDLLDKLENLDPRLVAAADRPPEPKPRWHFNWGSLVAVAMILCVLCLSLTLSYLIDNGLIPAASKDNYAVGAASHEAPDLAVAEDAEEVPEVAKRAADFPEELPAGVVKTGPGYGENADGTPQYRWDKYTLTTDYVESFGGSVPVEEYFKYTGNTETEVLAEECDTDPLSAWSETIADKTNTIEDKEHNYFRKTPGNLADLDLPALSDPDLSASEVCIQPNPANTSDSSSFNWLNVLWQEQSLESSGESSVLVDAASQKLVSVNFAHKDMVGGGRTSQLMQAYGETMAVFPGAQVSAIGALNGDKVFTGWMEDGSAAGVWFRVYCSAQVPVQDVQTVLDWTLDQKLLLDDPYNTQPSIGAAYYVEVATDCDMSELENLLPEECAAYFPLNDKLIPSTASTVKRRSTPDTGQELWLEFAPEEGKPLATWAFYETYDPDKTPQDYPDTANGTLQEITREALAAEYERQRADHEANPGLGLSYRLAFFWDGHYISCTFREDATLDEIWDYVWYLRNCDLELHSEPNLTFSQTQTENAQTENA